MRPQFVSISCYLFYRGQAPNITDEASSYIRAGLAVVVELLSPPNGHHTPSGISDMESSFLSPTLIR